MIARRVQFLVLAGLLVLASASSVAAQYVEDGIKGAGKQHVIITITPGRENEVMATVKSHGGSVKSQHPSINGVAADISGSDALDLAQHGAATITRDHINHFSATTSSKEVTAKLDPNASQPMTVSTLRVSLGLNAGAAANMGAGVINGSGVGVAIVDSGIAPSGDFGGRITGFYDFTKAYGAGGPVNSVANAYDDLGHGTHVAGLIASAGAQPTYMFQGVAPNARIVALKVLDKNGAASTSTVIAAIEFIVKNQKALGVQVINLSLGHPITAPAKFDPLVQAVEDAARHSLIVVVAAGNDGPGYASINSPANAPSAITVGAADGKTTVTRADDYVPSFSSRGPTWYDGFAKPDVAAPGVNLFSNAAPNSTLVKAKNPAYPQETVDGMKLLDLSGTSMAAAVATGVVALELDANSHQATTPLTPNAAKAILEYTAIKMAKADALTQGAGQINAAGAVQLASSINTSVSTGSWWLQTGVTGSSVIGGKSYAWAQNIIWGTSVIGGRFIYYKNLAWDDNIIWGTGLARGKKRHESTRLLGTDFTVKRKSIVWGKDDGDNIIWGTDGVDNIIWGTQLTDYRILGKRQGNKIVWAKDDADNIIWGTDGVDNIIWGTDDGDNIIWGTWSGDGDNIIWGTTADDNIIWGTDGGDNIIWGTSAAEDNIIWGTSAALSKIVHRKNGDNIIWGTGDSDNIIWGTADDDNIIWGTSDDNIIWGTDDGDNIIWGTGDGDNIIWGTSAKGGK